METAKKVVAIINMIPEEKLKISQKSSQAQIMHTNACRGLVGIALAPAASGRSRQVGGDAKS